MATPELIQRVAGIIARQKSETPRLVVVVSAMGKSTDQLLALAGSVSKNSSAYRREIDMLLTTGERVSMSLLSMALQDLKVDSISFTGSQSGIITTCEHGEARIVEIRPQRIMEALATGKVVIVAGFQGVSTEKEITTLGRGGSDTSAVALGAALCADQVDIYTDVDGFYTADPRIVPKAKRLDEFPIREAYLAASRGAKVLHSRCLEIAYRHKTRVRVLSTFDPNKGATMIVEKLKESIEGPKVLQIARQNDLSLFTIPSGRASTHVPNSDYVDLRISPHQLEVILSNAQLQRLSENLRKSPESKDALSMIQRGLTRLSIIGSGLDQAPGLVLRIQEQLVANKIQVLSEHRSESTMEYLLKDSPAIDALIQKLHEELFE